MTPQAPRLVTAPTALPLTLGEAKVHARVDSDHEDDLITTMIKAATAHFDGWGGILGRCIMEQTWAQSWSCFPAGDVLRLPFPDVSAVEITYFDVANTSQTVGGADITIGHDAAGSFVHLADGLAWPSTATRPDAVTVEMTAALPADKRETAKIAIALLVAHWVRNREAVGESMSELPMAVSSLIGPLRRVSL